MVTLEEASCIEAGGAEVVEIFRATAATALESEDSQEFPALAFICVSRQKEGYRVHVAFHLRELKRSLIYAVDEANDDPLALEGSRQKAQRLVETMGFQMERVNLKYSAAMREVILRQIPVLLPPEMAKKAAREKAAMLTELEQRVAAQAADEQAATKDPDLPLAEWTARKQAREARAAAARAAAGQLAAEKRMAEQAEGVRKLVDKYLEQVNAPETAAADQDEHARLHDLQAAAERRAAELAVTVGQLEGQLAASRAGEEQLKRAKAAAEKRQRELERIVQEAGKRAEAEAARQQKLAQTRAADEKRQAVMAEELRQAREAIETGNAERQRLAQGKKKAEERLAELEQKLKAAAAPRPEPETAGGEAAARVVELEDALRQAENRAEFLRLELERLAAAKALAEMRVTELEKAAGVPAAGTRENSRERRFTPTALAPARVEAVPPPHVVRRPPPPGAVFRVDWDLSALYYSSPNDVVELYHSMNMVRLSLEGYPDQFCSAYIVVLKEGEDRRIFVPFRLSESERVLVYVPARPPESQADHARTMQEAKKFLQVVGIDVEPVPLGKKPGKRARDLESIPIFSTPSRSAGNF